jgi:hypothetical protein
MDGFGEGGRRAPSAAAFAGCSSTNPAQACDVIVAHLGSGTYDWIDERGLQDEVDERLAARFSVLREKALSPRDRPDFLVSIGGCAVAVEVKVKGSPNAILSQLGRYAAHAEVDAVILASGRRTLLAGVPAVIHATPVAVVYLGGGL